MCTPLTEFRYGEFQIDLAAGLEESLILAFDPPWNGREETRVLTEDEEREATEEAEATALKQRAFQNVPIANAAPTPPSNKPARFQIKLGSTYYNQGIINPGVEASQQLGEHGDPVIVYLGDESRQVDSVINRTANVNGSCRIVGNNRRIADWFQQNFALGDVAEAIVQDPHHVLLQGPHRG